MLKVLEVSKIMSVKNIRNEHDKDIAELADSINRQGLINPITVMSVSGGKYRVIAGHRRLEAVKRLGLPHIECQILESMSEKDIVLTQLAENVQRKNMSAQELVDVFEELKEKYHMKQNVIAKLFGKDDSWVSMQYQAIRMLEAQYGDKIPEECRKYTANQIKHMTKKAMIDKEVIFCKGMKVEITGHKYVITCETNDMENELRAMIKKHRRK